MSEPDDVTAPTEVPATGLPRVDAALDRLHDLEQLPVDAHAEVFDSIHASLRDALADAHDTSAHEAP